jgi:hypothetical protein
MTEQGDKPDSRIGSDAFKTVNPFYDQPVNLLKSFQVKSFQ